MLVKKLVPFKFLGAALEIVMAGVLLSTSSIYPTLNGTSQSSFTVGCVLVIIFCVIQLLLTMVGVNIYSRRIHFENLVLNALGVGMLVWFSLALWQREYIWYIWGFLCVYPLVNELAAFVSVICHNKRIVFEKFRSNA